MVCIYCIFTHIHMCTVLLFLGPPPLGSSLFVPKLVFYTILTSAINALFKVVYILVTAIHMIIFTYI